MKKLFAVLFVFMNYCALSQVSIIPVPVKVSAGKGNFILNEKTIIAVTDQGDQNAANFLQQYLKTIYRINLRIGNKPSSNYIAVNTKKFIQKPANDEHYSLTVSGKGVEISGDSYRGSFYGIQSLIQLLPVERSTSLKIPVVSIDDQPRFSYRGMHLDVARHFMPVDFVKRYIDYLALHKMNTFHWHLTDDQGWRFEIKKYPALTTVGGYRNGTIIGRFPGKGNDSLHYGGFFTQDDVRDVLKHAASRFITVIPEIEMPGHASAAIAAYPSLSCFPDEDTKIPVNTVWAGSKKGKQVQQTWGVFEDVFCAGKDETFTFLQGVLDEVIELFPAQYIHIGGDECPKANWKRCPDCQSRIKELKLKDEHELQSYFIQRMEKYINAKGKKIIGWDEILEGGLAPNATVMSWRGEKGGIEAAQQNHDVIMTPQNFMYFDHSQSKNEDSVTIGGYTPLDETYSYDPEPTDLKSEQLKYILGAQANLWTEYIKNTRKVEYQVFPRIAALSELQWSPKEKKNWNDFEKRIMRQYKRYDLWGVNYSTAHFELRDSVYPNKNFDGVYWQLKSKNKEGVIQYGYGIPPAKHVNYTTPILLKKDTLIAAAVVTKNAPSKWLIRSFDFNKATGRKITLAYPPATTYPGNVGAFGLVNGLRALQFNSTEWLGFSGKNLEAVIDLGSRQIVESVSVHTWKQEGSWIYLPAMVEVFISDNGTDWFSAAKALPVNGVWRNERTITLNLDKGMKFRYLKLVAQNVGLIADGKAGAGNQAWLFVDEIEVK